MKYIKKFNESNEIKYLKTDDSDISIGNYFLEENEYNYIHVLVNDDDNCDDYKLDNGIEVDPLTKSDFDWNKKIVNYKKILYLGSNLS
mgnify:FL=1